MFADTLDNIVSAGLLSSIIGLTITRDFKFPSLTVFSYRAVHSGMLFLEASRKKPLALMWSHLRAVSSQNDTHTPYIWPCIIMEWWLAAAGGNE